MYGRSGAARFRAGRSGRGRGGALPTDEATAVIGWFELLRGSSRDAGRPGDRIGSPRIALAHVRAIGTDAGFARCLRRSCRSLLREVAPLAGPRVDVDAHRVAARRVDEPLVGPSEPRL